MKYDSYGLIVQTDGDGGDTAGREGDFWFFEGVMNGQAICHRDLSFKDVLFLLQVGAGVFVRNPVHYNDPNDFSRDQTIPLILAMGEKKEYNILKLLLENQVKRFFRYQNGDIGFVEDLGYYIRAFNSWYAYPLLLLGDMQMLVNSVIRCIKGRDPIDTSDDINHTLALIQAQKHLATPISWIARKVYTWFRPGGVQAAWDRYFNPASGANEFNEVYRLLIKGM